MINQNDESNETFNKLQNKRRGRIINYLGIPLFLLGGLSFVFFQAVLLYEKQEISINGVIAIIMSLILCVAGHKFLKSPRRIDANDVSNTFDFTLYSSIIDSSGKNTARDMAPVKINENGISIDFSDQNEKRTEMINWSDITYTKWRAAYNHKGYEIKAGDRLHFFVVSGEKTNPADPILEVISREVEMDRNVLRVLHQYARFYADNAATKWSNYSEGFLVDTVGVFLLIAGSITMWLYFFLLYFNFPFIAEAIILPVANLGVFVYLYVVLSKESRVFRKIANRIQS